MLTWPGWGRTLFLQGGLAEAGTTLEGEGGGLPLELRGARPSYFGKAGTAALLALTDILFLCLGGQQTARVPGMGGQGSWVRNGASQRDAALGVDPRGRGGSGMSHTGKGSAMCHLSSGCGTRI